jgi:hypothetical protein
MMAAGSELERRRLLEVRGLHPAVPLLVLHPLLTVVTGFGRDASDTVVEGLGRLGAPLGPAVTGTAQVAGRVVELPGAYADPSSRPEVVRGPMIVGALADNGSATRSFSSRQARAALEGADPEALATAVASLVAPAGPPVVVGECFAELSPRGFAAVLGTLEAMSRRRQVIIVTECAAVGTWAEGLGLDGGVWSPADAQAAARARPPEPAAVAAVPVEAVVVAPEISPEPEPPVEPPVEVEAEVEVEPVPPTPPAPEKAKRRRRRKEEPAALPWENRFDTSRERVIPGRLLPATPPPPGTAPLTLCVRHRGVLTRVRCARCNQPACEECIVKPRRRPEGICVECAIIASGVRRRRRSKD